MHSPSIRWPPWVGDAVGLKHYRLVGTVLSIEGSGRFQAFTVLTDPPATNDPLVNVRLATTVGRSRGTYRLDELVPCHRPQKSGRATIAAARVGTRQAA